MSDPCSKWSADVHRTSAAGGHTRNIPSPPPVATSRRRSGRAGRQAAVLRRQAQGRIAKHPSHDVNRRLTGIGITPALYKMRGCDVLHGQSLFRPDYEVGILQQNLGTHTEPHHYGRPLADAMRHCKTPYNLRIAGVLGSIDEKIELNRKKIAELEALAKTIYDYWFVQFDFPNANGNPYKSSGGKMVWNEQLKREVPERWGVVSLSSLTERITKGTTPTSIGASFTSSGVRFIKVENIVDSRLNITPEAFISEETNARLKRSTLKKNDLLMTIAGRLGDVALVPPQTLPANTNQAVGIIRFAGSKEYAASYVHMYLATPQMHTKLQALNAQSIQKNLNLEIIGNIEILFESDTVRKFTMISDEILNRIFALQEENQLLTINRDALLPLLMNGQVGMAG